MVPPVSNTSKWKYYISTNLENDNVSVLICVHAIGEMAAPIVVYKYIWLPAVYSLALPPNWSIGTSETGCMSSETYLNTFLMYVFNPFVKKHTDESIIVFFDGHKSHSILINQ